MGKYLMLDKLFDNRRQWTKGASGRDVFLDPVENYKNAQCWCLAGRLEYLFGIKGLSSLSPIVIRIAAEIRSMWPERVKFDPDLAFDLIAFNDHPDTTFDDVQNVLKWADASLAKEKVTV